MGEQDLPYFPDDPKNFDPINHLFFKQSFDLKNNNIVCHPLIRYDSSFRQWKRAFDSSLNSVTIVFSEEVFFQNSFGQFLYLHHSVARALELKSNVIRVSNGGKSSYILPNGNFYEFEKIQEYNVPIY